MNVQCLINKNDQLWKLVYEPRDQPDILGITETWLGDKYDDSFVNMPGYHNPSQRKDRTYAAHGGVITYISDRYDYERRDDLEVSSIETIWIEIKPSKSANILVCTVCRPEEERMLECNVKFRQEMESAYIENKEIILMGDFNIDLLRDDEVLFTWKDFIDGFSLTQVIEEPTRVNSQVAIPLGPYVCDTIKQY